MEQIGYQIVHSIAGRIRIRVSWLETDVESASKYQRLLEALSYVDSVRANPLANSIVISYHPKQLNIAEAEELFIGLMQQVKLTPPVQATTIETPPETEPPSDEPVPEHSQTVAPPASTIPDIPSPWDESIENPNPVEPTNLSPEPHSTASLAERLKVTSQAITRRRAKADFQTWTQAQDPERIAWYYDETSRLFHPSTMSKPDSLNLAESIDETLGSEGTKQDQIKARSISKKKQSF